MEDPALTELAIEDAEISAEIANEEAKTTSSVDAMASNTNKNDGQPTPSPMEVEDRPPTKRKMLELYDYSKIKLSDKITIDSVK